MSGQNFKIKVEDIKDLVSHMGYSIVSNTITMDGLPVGYMYREEPGNKDDSGWRFLSGTETQEYVDDEGNSKVFDVNTVANYDPAIIPYLKMPYGTELERVEGKDEFQQITD